MAKLQPFDIEKAKNGAKVVTRDGRSVRILCYDSKARTDMPILCLISNGNNTEQILTVSNNGRYDDDYDSYMDLMHPEPEMWVNVYKINSYHNMYRHGKIEQSKEAALKRAATSSPNYVGTYKLVKE